MSCIPVPIVKLTTVESTDLDEATEAGIHYQYDQETETSPIILACLKREANIDYQYQSL